MFARASAWLCQIVIVVSLSKKLYSHCSSCLVLLSGIRVIVELWVPQALSLSLSLSLRLGQYFCGLLVLPQEDLLAQDLSTSVVHRNSIDSSVGNSCVLHSCQRLLLCVYYVHACVCVCVLL